MMKKVVMMGTTDFAVPALEKLAAGDWDVCCVVCQPDRPNGRGKKVRPLPMKRKAEELGIPVFQPEHIRDEKSAAYLKSLDADFFVVAAYGQILPKEILDMPKIGCINIHGSLLPEYRGAAPIHHAIIDGKTKSGVTIMKMDVGMDTGDMLSKVEVPITDRTTVEELHDTLAEKGAELLIPTMTKMIDGTIAPQAQDEAAATYADKVDRETGHIDWSASSKAVLRRINGTDPYPGPWTTLDGKKVKIFSPEIVENHSDAVPGTVLSADSKNGLVVKTGDAAIKLGEIQMPGKRRMKAEAYFLGNTLPENAVFGD